MRWGKEFERIHQREDSKERIRENGREDWGDNCKVLQNPQIEGILCMNRINNAQVAEW